MGNRALRKKVAARLKELGEPYRVYRGKGYRYPRASAMWHFLEMTNKKVGDIVNDCDGNNHVIAKLPVISTAAGWMNGRGYFVVAGGQFTFEDGSLSCGCPYGPYPPLTRDSIERQWVRYIQYQIDNKTDWLEDWHHKIYEVLKAGGHVHDERGVLLKEYER